MLEHPLQAIYEKIDRAEETLGVLKQLDAEFLKRFREESKIFQESDSQHKLFLQKISCDLAVPIRFAVLSGEIIYQLRSCLDHLVVALAIREGQQPIRNHQFPICTEVYQFDKASHNGCMKGVREEARKIIFDLQPFKTASADTSTLYILNHFSNRDKHRLILVLKGAASIGQEVVIGSSDKVSNEPIIINHLGEPSLKEITQEGSEVFRVGLGKPEPGFFIDSKYRFETCFQIDKTQEMVPMINTLEKMTKYTRKIISNFDNCFKTN